MKGDFTRFTFNPRKQYTSVRMQQGRVQLDADWNEQVDIEMYRDQVTTSDIIGVSGVAGVKGADGKYTFNGFKFIPNGTDPNFKIGAGRMYVDGILCENNPAGSDSMFYSQQAFQPSTPGNGPYVAYLDVWQRHITALDDPEIQEVALGGPDTATRTQTIWQVKLLSVPPGVYTRCSDPISEFNALVQANDPRLGLLTASVQAANPSSTSDPCILPPTAGYRGLENQLYRVEIHNGGTGNTVLFKWSRDNGSVVVGVEQFSIAGATKVKVKSLGRDEVYRLKVGDTVEFVTELQELTNQPGEIRVIQEVDEAQRIITLDSALNTTTYSANAVAKVRRWEGGAPISISAGSDITLENGIKINFTNGLFQPGDYWVIPARTETGSIQWPMQGSTPLPVARHGGGHHYTKLALVSLSGSGWSVIEDCRNFAFPLTDVVNDFYYVSGDGQEAMPGQAVPKPLQVAVANRQKAVAGVRVKFTITGGTGTIAPDSGWSSDVITTGSNIIVITNSAGIASCTWTLDGTNDSQQVKAVIVDAANVESHLPPVKFNANLSKAALVAYTPPSNCTKLQGITNVQAALDELCECDCEACKPTLQVRDFTFADAAHTPFTYNAIMPIALLQYGFRMVFDRPIDPLTFNPLAFGFYIYVPFMYGCGSCTSFWYGSATPAPDELFYQPIFIRPQAVIVDPANPNAILWNVQTANYTRLTTVINALPADVRLPARFVAKGNFIWAATDQQLMLGGKMFPVGTHFRPPTPDDCINEGDFDFYWWFAPVVAPGPTTTVTNVTPNVPSDGQPCRTPFTITVRLNGPVSPSSPVTVHLDIDGAPSVFAPDMDVVFTSADGNPAVKTITIPLVNTTAAVLNNTLISVKATLNGTSADAQFWLQRCPQIVKCETNVTNNIVDYGQAYQYRATLERPAPFDTVIHVVPSSADSTVQLPAQFDVVIPAGQTVGTKNLTAPTPYGTGYADIVFTSTITTYNVSVGPCAFTLHVMRKVLPTITTFSVVEPVSKRIDCGDTAVGRIGLTEAVPVGSTVTVGVQSLSTYAGVPSTVVFTAGEQTKDFNIVAQNCEGLQQEVGAVIRVNNAGIQKEDVVVVNPGQTQEVLRITQISVLREGQIVKQYTNSPTINIPQSQMPVDTVLINFNYGLAPVEFTANPPVPEAGAAVQVNGPHAPLFSMIAQPGQPMITLRMMPGIQPGTYTFYLLGRSSEVSIRKVDGNTPLNGELIEGRPLPSGVDTTPGVTNDGGDAIFTLNVGTGEGPVG